MVESVSDIVLLLEPALEVLLAERHSCVVIILDKLAFALHFVETLRRGPAHGVLYLLLLLCEFTLHLLQSLAFESCPLLLPVLKQLLLALLSLASLLVKLGLALLLFFALATKQLLALHSDPH